MKKSAGILLFRRRDKFLEFFLVHPGGPFWKNKDEGAWSIPKGEFTDSEDPLAAAKREFQEETGYDIDGNFIPLITIQQKSGKLVYAWGLEGDIDETDLLSNTFQQEWPYKSGKIQTYPEVDKAGWFDAGTAKRKINPAQSQLIDDLLKKYVS